MDRMIRFYNDQVEDFASGLANRRWSATHEAVDRFIDTDAKKISWTVNLKADLARGKRAVLDEIRAVPSVYQPFCKQWLYFDRQLNERVLLMPRFFPTPAHHNLVIVTSGTGSGSGYSVLVTDTIPNLNLPGAGSSSQCFPLYYYEGRENEAGARGMFDADLNEGQFVRREAITDATLLAYRVRYGQDVTKEDIFYYVYGILHSPEYRERFANDLNKMIPRIPMAKHFRSFSEAGRDLASLHLKYETVDPWPVTVSEPMDATPEQLRVEQMRFGTGRDKRVIVYNSHVRVQDVPLAAYEYQVNGRSAIEWVMDRYRVSVDKDSGIRNDPNDWSDDPRYVLDLVRRIITVSMESVRIVKALPPQAVVG
jgi:predicted helicase